MPASHRRAAVGRAQAGRPRAVIRVPAGVDVVVQSVREVALGGVLEVGQVELKRVRRTSRLDTHLVITNHETIVTGKVGAILYGGHHGKNGENGEDPGHQSHRCNALWAQKCVANEPVVSFPRPPAD
jgi:hypothetical protein